jgi:membrane protease YdiL (CAAX protease family)
MDAGHAILLVTPPLLIATTLLVFRGAVALFGPKIGYLSGFLFYWTIWCLLLPWLVVGTRGLATLFAHSAFPFGRPAAVGIVLLMSPLVLGYGYAFPRAIRGANAKLIVVSALVAVVNATLEEILWRGTYLKLFGNDWLLAYAYPSVGFAFWHVAPLSVLPNRAPGGTASFVAVSGLVGLVWGWVAQTSGSILWPSISHTLFDFSGLGGRVYLQQRAAA